MTTVERSRVITAPASQVWSVLADFGEIASWAPNVDHSCLLTEGASGVGAVRRVQMGGAVARETIEEFTPESVLSYRITGLPSVVRSVTNRWDLTESHGSTTVTLTSQIDCGSKAPQRLLAKLIGRRLAAASEQMLAGLSDQCEHHRRINTPAGTTGDEQ